MSASHNSTQQAIDISAPNAQSILRFNETAHGDFWFEADVEFLTDPSARKQLGLWMTTGNGARGLPVRPSRRWVERFALEQRLRRRCGRHGRRQRWRAKPIAGLADVSDLQRRPADDLALRGHRRSL